MRIVAGEHRGTRIFAPKGETTRPTSDRVREAAFNLIGPVDGATVLDLFAGSGAMGLEALSRGAAVATFVECDRDAVRVIERNLDKLRVTDRRSPYGCCVLALTGHQTRLPASWPGGDRLAVHATKELATLGRPASLGCMRVTSAQARWLIRTIPLGAPVVVRS